MLSLQPCSFYSLVLEPSGPNLGDIDLSYKLGLAEEMIGNFNMITVTET